MIEDGSWIPVVNTLSTHPSLLAIPAMAAAGGVAFYWQLPRKWRDRRMQRTHGHRDPAQAAHRFRRYSELIREHVPLLHISVAEFSAQTGLRRRTARYLLDHPLFIPRPELLESICRALLVPPEWLEGGIGYGDDCVERRLVRYHDHYPKLGITLAKVFKDDPDVRRQMLEAVEIQLREEMDLPPDQGGAA
jgi:hypothetical protein